MNDGELLRSYVEHGDQAAFSEVVRRHVNLVYSTARRMASNDTHLAEDVSQQVFTAMAHQARFLVSHPTLAGWLHTTTRNIVYKSIRSENRRRAREQELVTMQNTPAQPEVSWDDIHPVLDEAVNHLGRQERDALVLRFFEDKSYSEVGDAVGINEDAARKRVARALDKLRAHFARRGVTVSSTLLAEAVTANAVSAAPAGLAENLSGTALAKAGTAPGLLSALASTFITMTTTSKIILGIAAIVVAVSSLQLFVHASDTAPANMPVASAAQNQLNPVAEPLASALPRSARMPATTTESMVANAPVMSSEAQLSANVPPVVANIPNPAQEAMQLLTTMKQSFMDMSKDMTQSSDLANVREKMNALQEQMDALKAKVAGTPLEQQLTPAVNALKVVQDALNKDDVTAVRAVLQKLSAGGPPVPAAATSGNSGP